MNVGLLLITQEGIGESLLAAATQTLGGSPMEARILPVTPNSDRDQLIVLAASLVAELDQGEGVLILTDLYGATPTNIASRIHSDHSLRVVTGINLPMLIRVLNYPRLGLVALANKALSGGRDGILGVVPTEVTESDLV